MGLNPRLAHEKLKSLNYYTPLSSNVKIKKSLC